MDPIDLLVLGGVAYGVSQLVKVRGGGSASGGRGGDGGRLGG